MSKFHELAAKSGAFLTGQKKRPHQAVQASLCTWH
jgi:hypothetical protein